MKSIKKTAIIAGVLFLLAMTTSLIGRGLLESILSTPGYLETITIKNSQVFTGIILELINSISVIGIAVILFPVLRQLNENLALGYFGFRIIESVFCIISAIAPLLLLTLSQEYLKLNTSEASYFHTLGELMIATRSDLADLLILVFFSLGALILYYLLYRSKLVPRFISIWGIIGVVSIIISNLLNNDSSIAMILAFPIILNEIYLGIWLIIKGFNSRIVITGFAGNSN